MSQSTIALDLPTLLTLLGVVATVTIALITATWRLGTAASQLKQVVLQLSKDHERMEKVQELHAERIRSLELMRRKEEVG